MRSILALVFVPSLMMCVQAQTWVGSYTVDSTMCDRTQCCCFSGTVTLTRPSTSVLSVSSGLSGNQCGNTSVFTYDGVYPSGYMTTLGQYSGAMIVTLSTDSKTITAVNPSNTACNGKAVKNDAAKPVIESMCLAVVILLAVISRMAN